MIAVNNDRLAMELASKLMIKVQMLLDAEVKTVTADLQDTQKVKNDARTISVSLSVKVAEDGKSIEVEGSSKTKLPARSFEKAFFPIDISNSGQINLFDQSGD